MPEQWLSVAEAAAAMKVHPRTIERRMVAGKIENRRNDDGQVQVLINLPEAPLPSEPVSSEAFETVKELANQQVDIAATACRCEIARRCWPGRMPGAIVGRANWRWDWSAASW